MKAAILGILAAATVTFGAGSVAVAQDAGDAAAGKRVFARCLGCHRVGPDAANAVGPELNGIVGRKIAGVEGYEYSEAMAARGAAGETWTAENLHAFLMNPQEHTPGTKMAFPGLPREADLANIIAYLDTFNADGSTK